MRDDADEPNAGVNSRAGSTRGRRCLVLAAGRTPDDGCGFVGLACMVTTGRIPERTYGTYVSASEHAKVRTFCQKTCIDSNFPLLIYILAHMLVLCNGINYFVI